MKYNFGGVEEDVVTREELSIEKARDFLKYETVAVIGYGVQGPAQALNLKDNGVNVIVGQRKEGDENFKKAIDDGFVEGETLFSIEEAVKRGTVVMYLLSDAGQKDQWPTIKKHLTKGKALYFSHGFKLLIFILRIIRIFPIITGNKTFD